jgi:hypothetical protein
MADERPERAVTTERVKEKLTIWGFVAVIGLAAGAIFMWPLFWII